MRRGITLPVARRQRRCRLAALGQILGAAILAGCGSTAATTTVATSVVAPSGLQYTITLTVLADQACTAERYSVVRATVRNFPQTTSFCGPIGEAVPPRLIQVARPAATLIVDRPARCGPVAIGRGQAPQVAAASKCSLAAPHLRLTLVPPGRLFRVTGIPGVPRLELARGRCSFICTRALTRPSGP